MKKAIFLSLIMGSISLPAAADEDFDAKVLDAIRRNPVIVLEALQSIKEMQAAQQQAQQDALMAEHLPALLDASTASHVKNPEGTITIVEYYDYNCGYCKRAESVVSSVAAENPDVRVLYKEFPIFGEASQHAARVSMALEQQGLFEEFHRAAMASDDTDSVVGIDRIARDIGADMDALAAAVETPAYVETITSNSDVAQKSGIAGTPAFIIGGKLHFGFLEQDEMEALITEERG